MIKIKSSKPMEGDGAFPSVIKKKVFLRRHDSSKINKQYLQYVPQTSNSYKKSTRVQFIINHAKEGTKVAASTSVQKRKYSSQ